MALKPGSSQRDYTLCSQFDDALDLPDVPAETDDNAEVRAAAIAERARKIKIARETSNWPLKPNARPTVFTFRHIPGTDVDWWVGQNDRLGSVEGQALLFRLALRGIENLGSISVKLDPDDKRLASIETLDALYAIADGRKVVGELAAVVAAKTFRGVDPL